MFNRKLKARVRALERCLDMMEATVDDWCGAIHLLSCRVMKIEYSLPPSDRPWKLSYRNSNGLDTIVTCSADELANMLKYLRVTEEAIDIQISSKWSPTSNG